MFGVVVCDVVVVVVVMARQWWAQQRCGCKTKTGHLRLAIALWGGGRESSKRSETNRGGAVRVAGGGWHKEAGQGKSVRPCRS